MINLNSFCSVVCRAGSEPLLGSAISAKKYLFISWPRHFWASNQFDSQFFPADLALYLRQLQKEKGIATRLIHQQGRKEARCKVMIMPDEVCYPSVEVNDIREVLENYLSNSKQGKYQQSATRGAFIFCCTHGSRDLCCAKFGFAALKEFQNAAKTRGLSVEAWESTHLGGDRFAANAIVFPSGQMYGRIQIKDVNSILDCLAVGKPFAPCYRGAVSLTGVDQLAEAFGHLFCYEQRLDANVLVGSKAEISPDRFEIFVTLEMSSGPRKRLRLVCIRKEFQIFASCNELKANKSKRAKRWVIESFS